MSTYTFTEHIYHHYFSAPSVGIFFGVFFSVNTCQSFILSHSNVNKTCITRITERFIVKFKIPLFTENSHH